MDTDGVNVLNRTHNNSVVCSVTHELELVFLPAQDALFQQHFTGRAGVNTITGNADEVLFVVSKS